MKKPTIRVQGTDRVLDARPDPLDFRDRMYEATLVNVPPERRLEDYIQQYPASHPLQILNQESEGACTGFGLAAVANYLLRTRNVVPDPAVVPQPFAVVSPRMLYEMAKRYDEWPGEDYSGSSARGAMKGWNKHGVCSNDLWPYVAGGQDSALTSPRAKDAISRPLGSYFRVNHQDLVAMHAAITEVGILYATSQVHSGWRSVKSDGIVVQTGELIGGHAFAIVAYDDEGFWIQNSWGDGWGKRGFCKMTYDDWLENGTDTWVARLAAPVMLHTGRSISILHPNAQISTTPMADLRPHIIAIGNDGQLRDSGPFATNEKEVESIFAHDLPAITANWKKKRIVLYAHGGLVPEEAAIQRVSEYRPALLENEIFPISFIWKSDYFTTVKNVLSDAFSRRRPEGFLDSAKDFLLDRADDALEPLARTLTGKAVWDEMKENAVDATTLKSGGARKVVFELFKLVQTPAFANCEIHLVGHSAGAIFLGPLAKLLAGAGGVAKIGASGFGLPVKSCTLWAPACTIDFFKEQYGPVMSEIDNFAIFTLTDAAEQDDNCAGIYHKSLLYLVSNAFEKTPHIPLLSPGEPILGMEKWIVKQQKSDADFRSLMKKVDWVRAPNTEEPKSGNASTSHHHGDFDDDDATVRSTLMRMLGTAAVAKAAAAIRMPEFAMSRGKQRDRRRFLDAL